MEVTARSEVTIFGLGENEINNQNVKSRDPINKNECLKFICVLFLTLVCFKNSANIQLILIICLLTT